MVSNTTAKIRHLVIDIQLEDDSQVSIENIYIPVTIVLLNESLVTSRLELKI